MLFPLLIGLLSLNYNPQPMRVDYSSMLDIQDGVLVEVLDKTAEEIRIYKEDNVTKIGPNAFDGCSFTTIMVSSTVREVETSFPNGTIINYTGAFSDIQFNVGDLTTYEYACDEGFLNFWASYIRPNIDGSICDVTKANYEKMMGLYANLSDSDKEIVNQIEDGTSTIKDSIKFLNDYFSPTDDSKKTQKEIASTTMITIILIIAAFGMTSIGVFYFLKDKNIIE
ncbi:MAG: hypothetical protein K6C32_00060 [Bacilli bacterium]|nr:hypothetical protein [Bacilli bacterium]